MPDDPRLDKSHFSFREKTVVLTVGTVIYLKGASPDDRFWTNVISQTLFMKTVLLTVGTVIYI